ncbi:hypothetical protein IAT38_006889 [Cryptococcus sp. DSM 104549]
MLSSVSLLVAHPTSISLTSLAKPSTSASIPTSSLTPSSTPLVLPSRFPSSHQPHTATSPGSSTGIFVYTPAAPSVWVYDTLARRVGEMGFKKGERVEKAVGVERGAVVLLREGKREEGKERVVVMEKDKGEGRAGRWVCVRELEMPAGSGRITAIAADKAGVLLAVGSQTGSLVLFDLRNDSRSTVPLGNQCVGPIPPHLAFSPSIPNTLLLPSSISPSLFRITFHPCHPSTPPDIIEIHPFGNDLTPAARISAVCFSPVVEADSGKTRGGLCAVLCEGEVALVGLDSPDNAPKRVTFGEAGADLEGLVFLDGATLAARTQEGAMLVKDLRALRDAPVTLALNEPITGLTVLPPTTRRPRPSVAPSATSPTRTSRSTRTISSASSSLADSHSRALAPTNPNIPAPSHRAGAAGLGEKPKDKLSVSEPREGEVKTRRAVSAVSAVSGKEQEAEKVRAGARSISGPSVTGSHRVRASAPALSASVMSGVTAPIKEEEEEETTPRAGAHAREAEVAEHAAEAQLPEDAVPEAWHDEPSVDLTWALRPITPHAREVVESVPTQGMSEREQLEEMRREMGNLQMDMLRMGRGLKNEIRKAVQPLLEEVREGREVIEQQRREIERLRRGY